MSTGKRKVGPTGKSHDNSVAKRARKLAEESAGQKGSILKHVQTGIFGGQKAAPKERARKYNYSFHFFLF